MIAISEPNLNNKSPNTKLELSCFLAIFLILRFTVSSLTKNKGSMAIEWSSKIPIKTDVTTKNVF